MEISSSPKNVPNGQFRTLSSTIWDLKVVGGWGSEGVKRMRENYESLREGELENEIMVLKERFKAEVR